MPADRGDEREGFGAKAWEGSPIIVRDTASLATSESMFWGAADVVTLRARATFPKHKSIKLIIKSRYGNLCLNLK